MVTAVLIALFLVILCMYYRLVILTKDCMAREESLAHEKVKVNALLTGVIELYSIAEQISTCEDGRARLKDYRRALTELQKIERP